MAMAAVSAREASKLFAGLAGKPALVLAVSGGPDSTALLLLAARWRASRKSGPRLLAVTIDHGLRPESAEEAKQVKRFAKNLRVAHKTLRWRGRKPATRLQEQARAARYRLLAEAARSVGAHHILTAHTLDDQAETVLLRLLRGSGLAGLAAMGRETLLPASLSPGALTGGRARRDETVLTLVRPLLDIPKARLVATLRAARLAFAEDPSNLDPRFARVRLRNLMPALAAEGFDAKRAALLARRMRRANVALEAAVDEARSCVALPGKPGQLVVDARHFEKLPAEVALRLLGDAVASVGREGSVELGKLESLYDELQASRVRRGRLARFRRTLAGALVTRDGERLTIERAPARRSQGTEKTRIL
jgi:tRNA(Ile)-lysidine synthase